MTLNDELLTETQAALYLGNTEQPFAIRTLQRWRVESFGPKFIKLGKSVRYKKSELDNFINKCVRSSTAGNGRTEK